MSKQLTCPRCGDVVYQWWAGRLTVISTEGHQITPSGWAMLLRLVQQDMASASVEDPKEAEARFDFVRRNIGELSMTFVAGVGIQRCGRDRGLPEPCCVRLDGGASY